MYNPGVTSPSSDDTPDGTTDDSASLSEAQVGAPVTAYEKAIRHLEMARRIVPAVASRKGRATLHVAMAAVWSDLAYTEAFREGLGTPEASEGRSEAHRASMTEHLGTLRVQPGPQDQATRTPEPVSPHVDVRTYDPGAQWVDRDGDWWTVIGFLEGGHVLVSSGSHREAVEWVDTQAGDGDLRTLAYVEKTWGPLRRVGADATDG